jgi:hypothetical protein
MSFLKAEQCRYSFRIRRIDFRLPTLILLSCAYRKSVSVLIANQRQRKWRNDTNFKMAVYWRVKFELLNLRLKLYIKCSQNNVILLVWIWQMSIVHLWQPFEGFHHLIRSGNELIRNFWQENWLIALRILLWNYESNDSSTCCRCRCISSCKCWCLCTSQFSIFIGDFN